MCACVSVCVWGKMLNHSPPRLLQVVLGPDGQGGYQHTVRLAQALVELRHHAFVTQRQVREIVALWQKLSDRDKAAISFPPRHQDRLVKGRFKTSKQAHKPGQDSVKR